MSEPMAAGPRLSNESWEALRINSYVNDNHDTVEVTNDGQEIVWKTVGELGYGFSGQVWLERAANQNKLRAVKVVRKSHDFYLRELRCLCSLKDHDVCFVHFYGFYENTSVPMFRNSVFFAMEYFPNGDLEQFLVNQTAERPCTEADAQYIASQLLHGLKIMHGLGIAHRDIKPSNIFVVQRDPFWWLKLGDFGASKDLKDLRTAIGTVHYEAPELHDPDVGKYTSAVDMWSLGCVIYRVLIGNVPFVTADKRSTLKDFISGTSPFPTSILRNKGVSPAGISFLQDLICIDHDRRPTAAEGLGHRWFYELERWAMNLEERVNRHQEIEAKRDDIIIAVLGVTGSGKSRFISHFTDRVKVGHTLQSETRDVEVFEVRETARFLAGDVTGRRILLVDTPGFDDTIYSEGDVLRMLAEWLCRTYSDSVRISGIVYLYDISNSRITSSLRRNIRLLRNMVGESLKGIVLVFSKWDQVSLPVAMEREREILQFPDFVFFERNGSRHFRSQGDASKAEAVISYLVSREELYTLAIQEEMVDRGMRLDETAAGLSVMRALSSHRERYESELRQLEGDVVAEQLRGNTEVVEVLSQERERLINDWANIETRELQLQVDAMKLGRGYAEKKATEWKELMELLRRTEAAVVEVEEQRQANTGDSRVGQTTAGSAETPYREDLRERSMAMEKTWRERFQGR